MIAILQLFIQMKKSISDDEPVKAIRRKKQASMVLAAQARKRWTC